MVMAWHHAYYSVPYIIQKRLSMITCLWQSQKFQPKNKEKVFKKVYMELIKKVILLRCKIMNSNAALFGNEN